MKEDVIGMVNKNRECHPGGVQVMLVTVKHINDLESKTTDAVKAKEDAVKAMNDMAFHFRLYRLGYIAATVCIAAAAWLVGFLM